MWLPKMFQCYLQLFLLFQLLHGSRGVFFHERSHVILKPDVEGQKTFGFSLAYQSGTNSLVTGAPHSSQTGKVFNCPLEKVAQKKEIQCKDAAIDVDALAPYNKENFPSVNLNLGYSVSATNDYFFTCAPLWNYKTNTSLNILGTCFLYNDTAHRYKTFVETNENKYTEPANLPIGNGWRTLVDDDWLIVGAPPEVTYVNATGAPKISMETFESDYLSDKFRNIGFSFAAGKFFSTETIYAISSLQENKYKGAIHFLEAQWVEGIRKLQLVKTDGGNYMEINEKGPAGSMFGAAMSPAHLNADEGAELVVGAPASADTTEGGYETGAVHIYLGGAKFQTNKDVSIRHRVIFGTKDKSRFGTALAASDIDGDQLSELFVSAPFEDSNKGTLYIFSGKEINELLVKPNNLKSISMSRFKLTQEIRNDQFKSFGYSLHVIPDIDGNGCDELAVGSPESQNIMLLRCLPSVYVVLEAEYRGEQLKLQDLQFNVTVCVTASNLKNYRTLALALTLENEVKGNGVFINNKQTKLSVDLPGKDNEEKICREVTISMTANTLPGDYYFSTKVKMDDSKIINADGFDASWALIHPYSRLEASTEVSRRCKDSECNPEFVMNFSWTGGNIKKNSYDLGSSEYLAVDLEITNIGNWSWDACALMRVSGAPVSKIGCEGGSGQYKCLLPKGMKKNDVYHINVELDMKRPKSTDKEIELQVDLQNFCNNLTAGTHKNAVQNIQLHSSTNDIVLGGLNSPQYISDTKIQDKKDASIFISVVQEYTVENKGKVTWNNINADITIFKYKFSNSSRVKNAIRQEYPDKSVFSYKFDLPPGTTKRISAFIDIMKHKIMENLKNNKVAVESNLVLYFGPTFQNKAFRLSSEVTFQKDRNFAQNKAMIIFAAIIIALIFLSVIIYIMYKMQFFKSVEKTRLEQLKRQRKRNSQEQHTETPASNEDEIKDDELEMNVEDDETAFEIVDMNTPVIPPEK